MPQISRRTLRTLLFSFGLVALFAVLTMVTVGLSLKSIVHGALQKEAERKAVLWAQEFVAQVPELQFLAETGKVSPAQFAMINEFIDGGEIFRFKFFSPTGDLKFVSDEDNFFASGESTHSDAALNVYHSRQNDIAVKSGETVLNRPDTYVEAYIPATLPSGSVLGIMEVYVDVSFLAATLTGIVKSLGVLITSGIAIAFLTPVVVLVFRNHQMDDAQNRESWLAAILHHAPFEVVIKGIDGKILAISQNVAEEINLTVKDFVGKTTADFLPEEIAKLYMNADLEVVRTGKATQKEVVETINGTTRYSLSSKFPLMNSDGHVTGVCSITNDITSIKLSEAKLAQAQKMETIGQLTGGVAHDFNNLLSVVSGSLQLLEYSEEEAERKRLTRVALRAIEHGSGLTKQMLALSRRSPLISKPTNLNSSLAEFKEFFLRILPANIEFQVRPALENPNIIVDAGMLQNALLNVALNSKTAMPNGGKLTISADTIRAPIDFPSAFTLGGKCACLSITDNGLGISESALRSVFEPFFTTQKVGKGSGLGLSMVKGFIEQSNGLIQLDSTVGLGTTLKVLLPLTLETVDVGATQTRQIETVRSGQNKGTVLIVEDNVQLLNLIALKLEREKFQVIKVTSGDDALEILDGQSDIRLVVSDLVMPGVGQGIDVLLKAKSLDPPLPVILMSGYADISQSSQKELKLADKFIEKPLSLGKLSDVIDNLISS